MAGLQEHFASSGSSSDSSPPTDIEKGAPQPPPSGDLIQLTSPVSQPAVKMDSLLESS